MQRRSSRGRRIFHKKVGYEENYFASDRIGVTLEEDTENEDDPTVHMFSPVTITPVLIPPLTTIQKELWKMCRLGDECKLRNFLTENPGLDLDCRDSEGSTNLNEAATKAAQFSEIVQVLLEAGAGLEVADSLGNTPLHNAVLYFPSTQQTVDLLLEKGANVCGKNSEGATPVKLAEDKDLKMVLKELKKLAFRKSSFLSISTGYSNSPELKRRVFDKEMVEEQNKRKIIVKYNSPVVVNSPGLLKKKRKRDEDLEESFSGRSKRIRWCEVDSTGAGIDHGDKDNTVRISNIDQSPQEPLFINSALDDLKLDNVATKKLFPAGSAEDQSFNLGNQEASKTAMDDLENNSEHTHSKRPEPNDVAASSVKFAPGEMCYENSDTLNRNVKSGDILNIIPTENSSNVPTNNVKIVTFSHGFCLFVM